MTVKNKSSEIAVDIAWILRGDIHAFLITGTRGTKQGLDIFYILENGRLFLKDSKEELGPRNFEVKKGDIICLWKNLKTGYEEFCGFLDENGDSLSKLENVPAIPGRLRIRIKPWCENRKNLDFGVDKDGVWIRRKTGKYAENSS
jgi:hypothetical protein